MNTLLLKRPKWVGPYLSAVPPDDATLSNHVGGLAADLIGQGPFAGDRDFGRGGGISPTAGRLVLEKTPRVAFRTPTPPA